MSICDKCFKLTCDIRYCLCGFIARKFCHNCGYQENNIKECDKCYTDCCKSCLYHGFCKDCIFSYLTKEQIKTAADRIENEFN